MGGYWHSPDDYQQDAGTFSGSAHSVSSDKPDDDKADQVRKVAEEIARKPIPRPAPRRMGFL